MVLDTCALVWWTMYPDKLSRKAARELQNARRMLISSISIWEIGLKAKSGQIVLPFGLQEFVRRLHELDVQIVPVDERVWIANLELAWDHKDPADRTIVATAQIHSMPIVTADSVIKSFYRKVIW